MGSFFGIPGNIHQSTAVFVQNPINGINEFADSSRDLNTTTMNGNKAEPQIFSYKTSDVPLLAIHGLLNFYPSSLEDVVINDDIANKLLYGSTSSKENTNGRTKKDTSAITISDILNHIPGVQIREFLPDTRIDQCINMFKDMFTISSKFMGADSSQNQQTANQNTSGQQNANAATNIAKSAWNFVKDAVTNPMQFIHKAGIVLDYTLKYFFGNTEGGESYLDDLDKMGGFQHIFSGEQFETWNTSYKPKINSDIKRKILSFPFGLYYNLQSCTTKNIYYIPAVQTEKVMQTTNGYTGWTGGANKDDIMTTGGVSISHDVFGKLGPVVGKIASTVLNNVNINYMPWWDAQAVMGGGASEPEVTISFNLFNDTADAAMANFLFVNTLVQNNKFMQYGMFQHSSSLYDIKIEGVNRLFACAGQFSIAYEGILRDPPERWLRDLAQQHCNNCWDKSKIEETLLNDKIIKIPDVYKITMKFQSLLPANFNTFIYNYVCNKNVISKVANGVYSESGAATLLTKSFSKLTERIEAVLEKDAEAQKESAVEQATSNQQKQQEERKKAIEQNEQDIKSKQQNDKKMLSKNIELIR